MVEPANVLDGLSDNSETDFSDEEVAEIRKENEFKPVKGKPGMYYKVCKFLPFEVCILYFVVLSSHIPVKNSVVKTKLSYVEKIIEIIHIALEILRFVWHVIFVCVVNSFTSRLNSHF